MTRKDPVTPETRLALFARDGQCVAPLVDPNAGDCSGRLTVEHVKAQSRCGVRAPSRLDSMVSLCEGHTEPGMKAGRIWNTTREHRQLIRQYLRRVTA